MNKCYSLLFFLTVVFFGQMHSQERGYLEFRGKAIKEDKPLKGATITLFKGEEEIKQVITEKSGKFSFDIDFFAVDYKVTFSYPGCANMYLLILASTVPTKPVIFPIYQTEVPFYDDTTKTINLEKFKHPVTKVIFDGKQMFMDDETYMDEFARGIFPEEEKTASIDNTKTPKKKKQISGKIMAGSGGSTPVSKVKVYLVDSNGKILQTSTTNQRGLFIFNELPADGKVMVRMDEADASLFAGNVFFLTDKDGKEVLTAANNGKGGFEFRFLDADNAKLDLISADDVQLSTLFKGTLLSEQKKPLEGAKVRLTNSDGTFQTAITDSKGEFFFKNLPADGGYFLSMEADDPKLTGMNTVFISDEKGNIVKECARQDKGFNFSMLPEEKGKLSSMYVEDDAKLPSFAVNSPVKGKGNYPPNFSFADANKDNVISLSEINECIRLMRSGNPAYSAETVSSLVEWYLG